MYWKGILCVFIFLSSIPIISSSFAVLPPRQQVENGVNPSLVVCNDHLVLMMKIYNHSPICVTDQTATKLYQRKYADMMASPLKTIENSDIGILSGNVSKTDYMPKACDTPSSCPPNAFELTPNYEVDVYASNKVTLIGKTFSDDKGNYSIKLSAGNYTIFTGLIWNKQASPVSVFAGKNTIFNIVWGNTS